MDRKYQLLYTFGAILTNPTSHQKLLDKRNGRSPWQQLAYDGKYLYSTTTLGGLYGHGLLFLLNTANLKFKVLHDFISGSRGTGEGYLPQHVILVHSTTIIGVRPTDGRYDKGIIYSICTKATDYRVLHSFGPASKSDRVINSDGMYPLGIVRTQRNHLVGITSWGGRYGGGTVVEINRDGTGFRVIDEERDKHDLNGVLPVHIWQVGSKIVVENSAGGTHHEGTLLILTMNAGKFATESCLDF